MSQKHQAIVIGIGETGADVIDRFVGDYGAPAQRDLERAAPEHVALVSHRQGAVDHSSVDGRKFTSHDEPTLLAGIAAAFERVLAERPDADYSIAYQLDVFVCGAWVDPAFGHHLPLVLAFIERLGHEHYDTMFTTRDDRQNARLLVHPLAISSNLPREPHREAIAAQLACIAHWHEKLAYSARSFIPRFFVYDGFTNNLQMTRDEMIDITANFLGLCVCSGLRARSELRNLLNFSLHGSDFFSVLNLATVRFDRRRYGEAAADAVVEQLEKMLLAKPAQGVIATTGDKLTLHIENEIAAAPHLNDTIAAGDYRHRILVDIEEYKNHHGTERPVLDQGELRFLLAAGQTFPNRPEKYLPETLDLFFDRRWLDHVVGSGQPADEVGVAGVYADNCRSARERWYAELQQVGARLDDGMRDLLGPQRAKYSLAAFCADLYRIRRETIVRCQGDLRARSRGLPAKRWRFTNLRDLWARLRAQVWNTVPPHALKYWMPTFAILATVQTIALLRFMLVKMDKQADGVKMLTRFDGGPLELPIMILLSLVVAVVPGWVFYQLKKRRLQPFLRGEKLTNNLAPLAGVEDEGPDIMEGDEDNGVLKTAAAIMARKMGIWWFRHGQLGAFGMAAALLKVVEARVDQTRLRAERALAQIEARHQARRLHTAESVAPTYFSRDIMAPVTPDQFADIVTGGQSAGAAAVAVAHDLFHRPINEFLEIVVDEQRLRAAARQGMPFFEYGDVFSLPVCAEAVSRNLRNFVEVLDDRLSHGQIFQYLATEEKDKLIEDSQILLVAPITAQMALEQAIQETGVGYRHLYTTRERDHVWGLRLIRDISTRSVVRYMLADTTIAEADALMIKWVAEAAGEPEPSMPAPEPWSELRWRA